MLRYLLKNVSVDDSHLNIIFRFLGGCSLPFILVSVSRSGGHFSQVRLRETGALWGSGPVSSQDLVEEHASTGTHRPAKMSVVGDRKRQFVRMKPSSAFSSLDEKLHSLG